MLLYYITDRTQFSGTERQRRDLLLQRIAAAARAGVDFVQLREKDLSVRDLESLAREAVQRIRESGSRTRLLINSRSDVALAAEADGVHLRSNDISPEEVRRIWREAQKSVKPIVAVSCHTDSEVGEAEKAGADFVVFGPVFEKRGAVEQSPTGIDLLRKVCFGKIPALALGGITSENAPLCIRAGAAGIAGIRLFQEDDLAKAVSKLRA